MESQFLILLCVSGGVPESWNNFNPLVWMNDISECGTEGRVVALRD